MEETKEQEEPFGTLSKSLRLVQTALSELFEDTSLEAPL